MLVSLLLLSGSLFSQTAVHFTNAPDSMGQYNNAQVFIDTIVITNNKITKDKVILRELLFKTGDTIAYESLDLLKKRSEENLVNTSLFNFVMIRFSEPGPSGSIRALVNVTERWYIWPIPILKISDRNFNVWWETRDLNRLNYGVKIDWQNFRGHREKLSAIFQFGYDKIIGLAYQIPYLNKQKTLGIGFGAELQRNREVAYRTVENRQVFIRDDDEYVRKDINAFMQFLYRRGIYNSHLLEVSYDKHIFSDTLNMLNPYYADGKDVNQYFSLHYKFKSDYRDYKPYPLTGRYFDFEFIKRGLGVFGEESLDFFYFLSSFRKYWQLSKHFYYAFGLNCKFSNEGRQPFYIVRAIGYGRDLVRGYEYYVVDGQNFGIWKNNLKFALLPKHVSEIKFIRSEKFSKIHFAFYLNLFFDIGYASNMQYYGDNNNDLVNDLLIGYGLGLDFVTYYDIVIRTEFSVNKMGETGFYLHFMAPI